MKRYRCIKPLSALLAVVTLLGFSGCRTVGGIVVSSCLGDSGYEHNEDKDTWDQERAIEIAKSYLEEKYDEEFVYFSRNEPAMLEELLLVCTFYRKADEGEEKPLKYDVDVVYEAGEYTVEGDNYMFEYVRRIADEFLMPYIENRFSDIEYVAFVDGASYPRNVRSNEFLTNDEIPRNIDDVYNMLGHYKRIRFKIIVPESEDMEEVSEARSLLESDLDNSNLEIDFWNYSCSRYTDERFEEISQSLDPYKYFCSTKS